MKKLFFLSVAILLLVTAAAKLVSAVGDARILTHADPLLRISNRALLVSVAVIELSVAAYLFLGRDLFTRKVLVLWLGASFTCYRLAIYAIAPGKPCSCLGTITEKLPVDPAMLDYGLKALIAYMIAGAVYFLISDRKTPKLDVQASVEAA